MLFWKPRFNLAHPFEPDQHQNFERHIDILASYPFSEIELEHECDLEPKINNSVSLLNSMLTPISLSHFKYFFHLSFEFCAYTS